MDKQSLFGQLKESPGAAEAEAAATQAWYARRRERHHASAIPATLLCDAGSWTVEQGSWPHSRLAILSDLPGGIAGLSEDRQAIGVFWDEQGEPEDVHCINRVLCRLLEVE